MREEDGPLRQRRRRLGKSCGVVKARTGAADKPSIAVLPFQNMSGDPEQEYFADGMVEEIITALSRFKWLFVIARNSSFTFEGKAVDVKQVGRRLRRALRPRGVSAQGSGEGSHRRPVD